MKKYIEIVNHKTEEVVKRVDITGKGERTIDRFEKSMNMNLNHEEYFTRITEGNE